jgi:putative FmdB family regulatory protein
MPLYEFVCRDCERDQEILVRGEEVPACASCGSRQLTKLLSAPLAHAAGTNRGSVPPLAPGGCGSGCACHGG